MRTNNEIAIEIAKNKTDEMLVKKELDTAKESFIKKLENGLGEEIKTCGNTYYTKPIKIKKSFIQKIKEFFNKLFSII